jgi:hypothetical protein
MFLFLSICLSGCALNTTETKENVSSIIEQQKEYTNQQNKKLNDEKAQCECAKKVYDVIDSEIQKLAGEGVKIYKEYYSYFDFGRISIHGGALYFSGCRESDIYGIYGPNLNVPLPHRQGYLFANRYSCDNWGCSLTIFFEPIGAEQGIPLKISFSKDSYQWSLRSNEKPITFNSYYDLNEIEARRGEIRNLIIKLIKAAIKG